MSARRSAECKHAIHLHQVEGKSVYAASKLAGIAPTTLYKALYPNGKKRLKKRLTSM